MSKLIASQEFQVRFCEVDALSVVWHGNYLQYFELGRDAFSAKFKMDYLYFLKEGYSLPVISAELDFKKPLRYTDLAIVEATYIESQSAKMIFSYRILKKDSGELICTGKTTQVFLNNQGILQLKYPEFFAQWKLNLKKDEL